MNAKSGNKWQPGFGVDGIANALIIATGVAVILVAAVTASTEGTPEYAQSADHYAVAKAVTAASNRGA